MGSRPNCCRCILTLPALIVALHLAPHAHSQLQTTFPLLGPWAPRAARTLYRPGELTVRFRDTVGLQRAADVTSAMGSETVYAARHVPGLRVVSVPAGMTLGQAIAAYAARADVQYAEPNYLDYPCFVPDDPRYGEQWHLDQIGCPAAWDTTLGSPSVIVAIVDTGVAFIAAPGHPQAPDLAGVTFVAPWDAVDGDTLPVDDEGHGTHVCGTIAQATDNARGVAGVAPLSSIMPIRSLGPNGGTHAQFADACHYAADNGARVLNYSAGGSDSETKREGVQYAYGQGVLICAAMGNDNALDSGLAYPGRYPEVVGVAASTIADQRAYYSNYGADVDLTGPGGDTSVDLDVNGFPDGVLQNTFPAGSPNGGFGYQYMMGTSMATPHVTGAAALVYAEMLRQGLSPTADSVRALLEETAQDLGGAGRDDLFGHGLVRPDLALAELNGPSLDWVGSPEYLSDGAHPDQGAPESLFKFRVKYIDPLGRAPLIATLLVQKLSCGGAWETIRSNALAWKYGRAEDGAVYFASTRLPNNTYRYRFLVTNPDGVVDGPPRRWTLGPMILDRPTLCWTGAVGFVNDGVTPNAGPGGTRFRFQVLYRDSRGNSPTTRDLLLRRNGVDYRTVALTAGEGLLQTGKVFNAEMQLTEAGTYEYRFKFRDAHGAATGAPTRWQAGPTLEGAATAQIVSAMAAQTPHGGAQVVVALAGEAAVTARVLNVAGREVRTIARDRTLPAGVTSLLWDGRSDAGLPVPAGTYLIHLEAADRNGARSRAVAALVLRR